MRFSYIDALPITFIRMLTEANKSLPPLDALLDTGSNISILPLEVGKKLGAKTRRLVAASNDAFLEQVLAGVPVAG